MNADQSTTTPAGINPETMHREDILEQHLVEQLVAQQGYIERSDTDYDRATALDSELVLQFVQSTQPDAWQRLTEQYSTSAAETLIRQLERVLKQRGTLDVLRNGLTIVPKIEISLCEFRPASGINPALMERYQTNILSVIRQVRYSQKNQNAIDVVLFVNGLPIATAELKNHLTGSTLKNAEHQYRTDRSPANEPLLIFRRGALVHFAIDETLVSMTTRLQNGRTRFLPFNRGRDGGAGNPDIPGEHRIAYLYADQPEGPAIFGRQVWLDILGRFMHLEKDDKARETMIFPRYQQLDAVMKLMHHARQQGPGRNYLIQHSAGSGKSNTIGWTAHQAINLHTESDQSIFSTVVIVTDRIVLDRQLQRTISQFEQTPGVVRTIDGTSRQLREAIEQGARIIVTTIQKFSTDHLNTLAGQGDRNFLVIIDEAHSSQSGKTADSMQRVLAQTESDSTVTQQSLGMDSVDIEDVILDYQNRRGPQPNISYIAFTATPRNVTLERFGTRDASGKPLPFHLYSMRQAIDEGFILDVLQNYTTYHAYFRLEKTIEDDPELRTREAQRKVARFASFHPTAIGQKVEVIVEHFRRHVMSQLKGQAKAMVVTGSREHALRYTGRIRQYLDEKGYDSIQVLGAFSGEVEIDGQTWSEQQLNGFPEGQLPSKFDENDEYRMLVVAEKYQTGFDQPKLCAMYIDRKLAGLQAVQTLSRLNRTAPGKDRTWVLDFQNEVEDIQEAFRPYFNVSHLEEVSDPNQIYDLRDSIRKIGVLDPAEVDQFAHGYYETGGRTLTPQDRARLEGLVRQAVPRFEALDEGEQEEFRQLLRSFQRFYAFVAQIVRLEDTDLEKLYIYSWWLSKLLPSREKPADIEIDDSMLTLAAFRLQYTYDGDSSLQKDDAKALRGVREFGASTYSPEEEKALSEIIQSFNERHGTSFTESDFIRFESINRDLLSQDEVQETLKNNSDDMAYDWFYKKFYTEAIRAFQRDNEMKSVMMTDGDAREHAIRHYFQRAMRKIRGAA